jgi:hypothetical protein
MTDTVKTFATRHEKLFLKGLGSFAEDQKVSRYELLQRYIQTAEYRTNWGEVDKYKVLDYARKCLRVQYNG